MGLRVVFDARVLARELPLTGIPRYLLRLLEALGDHPDMERAVLVTDRELVPAAYNLGNVEILPRGVAWQQRILTGWLRRHRERFDLLHNPAYATPFIHVLPTVTTVFDLCFKRYPALVKPEVRQHLRRSLWVTSQRSGRILVPTEDMRQEMVLFYPHSEARLRVTPLAGGLGSTPPEEIAGIQQPYFLWVGTRGPRKNLGPAIEAMKSFPNAGMVIVGPRDGTAQDEHLIEDAPGVTYTGFVSEGQLLWLYQHAVALIFSSLYEGFGMPVVEAMQHGCPVVCGAVPGVREVAGQAGIFVDVATAESLANGMRRAVDEDWRERVRLRGEQYSWANAADATVQVYEDLMGRDIDST